MKKEWILGILYFVIFLVTANFDYAFSVFMTNNPPVWLSEFGNHFGCTIGVLILSFCFACLAKKYPIKRWLIILPFIPAVIAGYYFLYMKTIPGYIGMVLIGIGIGFVMLKVASFADLESQQALTAVKLGIIFVLSGVIFNTVIKCFWGRPRFFTLTSKEDFVPWYAIQGFVTQDSHKSFPSGHVTNASFIIWLVNLKYFYPKKSWNPYVIYGFSTIWISLTALSRIAAGMHFLSDTLGAVGITLLFYVLLKKKWNPAIE